MEMNEAVKKYVEIQAQEEQLKKEKDELKAQILKFFDENMVDTFVTEDGIKATKTNKTTFKYKNESDLIEYLDSIGLDAAFVVRAVNSKALNLALKGNKELCESMGEFVECNQQVALTVK